MGSESRIVAFLTQDGRDGAGRMFDAVIAFGDNELERHHDFIQWLFPLDEASRAVPGSPVLDDAVIGVLRATPVTGERQGRAAARMLRFYRDTMAWRSAFDHNHLRITRIIKSLRLLSGDEAAERFKREITQLARDAPIDGRAREFWANA